MTTTAYPYEDVTASAPGKVLISGGYVVLETPNPGLVLAADKRFHSTVSVRSNGLHNTQESPTAADGSNLEEEDVIDIDVHSPQFDAIYQYSLAYRKSAASSETSSNVRIEQRIGENSHGKNPFVEKTLLLTFLYIHEVLGAEPFHNFINQIQNFQQEQPITSNHSSASNSTTKSHVPLLRIKLRADNDFYSQIHHLREKGLECIPLNVLDLPPFLPCPKEEGEDGFTKVIVNKTGMGSSAALVTSLVASLLLFFGIIFLPATTEPTITIETDEASDPHSVEPTTTHEEEEEGTNNELDLQIAHNLAQICHCYAQGKVGSGFDVSSAIYGSHVYTRFSKSILSELLPQSTGHDSSTSIDATLLDIIVTDAENDVWDCTVKPFSLPQGLELLMADVCGGSETPSMARKVLSWKQSCTTKDELRVWNDLIEGNSQIESCIKTLHNLSIEHNNLFLEVLLEFSCVLGTDWSTTTYDTVDPDSNSLHNKLIVRAAVIQELTKLRTSFLLVRKYLKQIGVLAGVSIEPDDQTRLADATMELPGVVAAGVPGAGGNDALFVIYIKGLKRNGSSDCVRDSIGDLWKNWENSAGGNENGGGGVVCPLAVRNAGYSGSFGLCRTNLGWS